MLDPQCEAILERVAQWPEPAEITAEAARAQEDRRLREFGGVGPTVAEVRTISIPTTHGSVNGVVYVPTDDPAPGVLVWIHGGGWIVGSPHHCDDVVRSLSRASGCTIVSVDYALAPEMRFPVAVEQCYDVLNWVSQHHERLGLREGPLGVGGDSAGGNLAAAVALMARDRATPTVDLQLLVYPALQRHFEGGSRRRYAEGYWLTTEAINWAWSEYLGEWSDGSEPYASPLLADSLAGVAPAHVVLAEYDVLHDEGRAYAERLRTEGVDVELTCFDGMLHGFLGCAAALDKVSPALDQIGGAVRRALAPRT